MRGPVSIIATALAFACAGPAFADSADFDPPGESEARELPPYLQCVPFARERSGVQIYGDAHTWWNQAEGRYKRGHSPRAGAVLAFRRHHAMRLGHVAAVSQVIDSRTVLLDHANWSPIAGRRGQIERGVKAIDVSPANDWSQVRVWYEPSQDVGTTAWPVDGFIYNQRDDGRRAVLANAGDAASVPVRQAISDKPSPGFLTAFASLEAPKPRRAERKAMPRQAAPESASNDVIGQAIARYDR